MKFDVVEIADRANSARDALADAIRELDVGSSYSEMMRLRVSGALAEQCKDVYYVCTDDENRLISRLWMGWGKHAGAVGNWGNFYTDPDFRGQGIGKKLLDLWYEDVRSRPDAPVALFCTAGTERLAKTYAPYGFRCAIKGASCGPLYRPLGDSPDTFEEFCRQYYKPASRLEFAPASAEWRHEIDCLFKFCMLDAGLDYLPSGVESLEAALINNDTSVGIIFTDQGIPVGVYKNTDGGKDIKLHPSYLHLI